MRKMKPKDNFKIKKNQKKALDCQMEFLHEDFFHTFIMYTLYHRLPEQKYFCNIGTFTHFYC